MNILMKPRLKKIAVIVAIAGISFSAPTISATSWMEDFYASAGASVNVTNPGVYQTQGASVYSGGGLTLRVPAKNFQPFAYTPPGLKAGCGGIDFWAGSFSFINKEAFVQFLRNIGQNAVGYFFQLALESISPEIAGVLKDLNKLAQDMNKFNMNSCQTAKNLVDNLGNKLDEQGITLKGATWGSASGAFGDFQEAVSNVRTDMDKAISTVNDFLSSHSSDNGGNGPARDKGGNLVDGAAQGTYNLLYKALAPSMDSSTMLSGAGFSDDEVGLIISLLGSPVYTVFSGSSDGQGGSVTTTYMPPIIDNFKVFMGDQTDSTTGQDGYIKVKIYDCLGSPNAAGQGVSTTTNAIGPVDGSGCTSKAMAGVAATKEYTGPGFKKIVRDSIQSMSDNMGSRTAQTETSMKIAVVSSLPVYDILKVAHESNQNALGIAATVVNANDIVDLISDLVAYELASHYMEYTLTEARKVVSSSSQGAVPSGEAEQITSMIGRIEAFIADAKTERERLSKETASKTEILKWITSVQTATHSGLSERLKENLAFNQVK